MSLRRIAILFGKDLKYESRNAIFVLALVMPIIFSLLISLLFNTVFNEQPTLGVVSVEESTLETYLLGVDFMRVQQYPSTQALRIAVENGEVEMGVVIPATFDVDRMRGESDGLLIYVWGESLIKNRAIILSSISNYLVSQSTIQTPISLNTVLVGERLQMSWQQRLLPLIVLLSVIIGGLMVPSNAIVEEKHRRTIRALTTTPMSLSEVFITKGLMGVMLSLISGFAILTLNGGWGNNPLLLGIIFVMAGTLASIAGILLGIYMKDTQTLFAVIKGTGILLYAPGLIALFPEVIPQWTAYLFPTYYIMHPVMEVSQNRAGFGDIAVHLLVLAILIMAMIALLNRSTKHPQLQEA